MKKRVLCAMGVILGSVAYAGTTTIVVTPDAVPDEDTPGVFSGAPTGFGPDSWQNTSITRPIGDGAKVNFHVRYGADGDYLTQLFGAQAEFLTVNDIASISYSTFRPDGSVSTEDWSIYIYTRNYAGDSSPGSGWYGDSFINNYNEHGGDTGAWTEYSTDSGMTFNLNSGPSTGEMTLAQLQSSYDAADIAAGRNLIEMISVQTHTNFNYEGSDPFGGAVDALTITLTNGDVGIIDFSGTVVPLPGAAGLGLLGLGLVAVRRRFRKAA